MLLGEQLSELRQNILRDRSDIIAGDTDSLWSDETLVRYIKDAERRFARQSLILRDATTVGVVQVRLKAGVQDYPLHKSVLSVISSRWSNDPFDLQRSGHALIMQLNPPEFLTFDPSTAFTIPPGRPLAYFTDETLVYAGNGRVTLSVYPVPSSAEDGTIIYMRVIRLPICRYSMDDLDRESELPEDYQLDALEWAAYRAQRGFDADAGAPTSADAHKKAFDEAILNAVKETKRKMFSTMPFRYGGNGFNWVR
jgi:hypothetical protein